MTDTDDAVRFTRPGASPREADAAARAAVAREDEPPPDVPRDQYGQPLIVAPDGSGVLAYRRASKYGGIIEDTYGLNQWGKRTVAFGLSRAHHLIVRAQAVRTQTERDDVAALQDIADRADLIAGADSGAVTGTGLHRLSEYRDRGDDLSYLDPISAAALDAYTALLQPFEVLVTELFVVTDDLQAAGTLDRVLRLRAPITWPDGVVWPVDMVVVIDVKTGKVSSAKYWGPGYTVQQWVYRTGVPYRAGTTVLRDPGKRSAANVEKVLDQPGDHGRLSWADVGVPQAPTGMLILHIPAADPAAARWERVDPDVAHADAQAARAAWERHRVPRGQRFLALPTDALPPAPQRPSFGAAEDRDTYTCTEHGPVVPHAPESYPVTVAGGVVLYCGECLGPDEDPAPWCGCRPGDDQCPGTSRQRAHDPADCPSLRRVGPGAAPGGDGVPDDPGPFDDTAALAALRTALREASDTATVDALYDAHGPDGDGLWDDECTARAQAAYDRLNGQGVPS